MKRTTMSMILAGSLVTGGLISVATAQEKAEKPESRRAEMAAKHIARFDTDGDGKVSEAEVEAFKAARFAEADANGDSKVTADELHAFHEAEKARREAERRAAFFARMDADGDGTLSEAEFVTIKPGRFDRMDRDDDGFIEAGEFGRGHKGDHKKKMRD
ncbi:MAG: hypothetical protein CME88_13115 [Hirschia sp.]|nr:hypothetical protein [Hirschia sp.]MBF19309.1 hypothetical protein [Hirschia sp.]|tara:strand:- start:318 stop:794 length:477 start_codon:yes stop_codon:yes gene_type:complete